MQFCSDYLICQKRKRTVTSRLLTNRDSLRFEVNSCFLLIMQKKNNLEPREKCYTISFRLLTGSYGFATLSVTTVFLQI